jgi:hypothetical protein
MKTVVVGGWVGLRDGAVAYLAPGDLLTDAVAAAIEDRDCELELVEASPDAARVMAAEGVAA